MQVHARAAASFIAPRCNNQGGEVAALIGTVNIGLQATQLLTQHTRYIMGYDNHF
jgi:hypothetical protein